MSENLKSDEMVNLSKHPSAHYVHLEKTDTENLEVRQKRNSWSVNTPRTIHPERSGRTKNRSDSKASVTRRKDKAVLMPENSSGSDEIATDMEEDLDASTSFKKLNINEVYDSKLVDVLQIDPKLIARELALIHQELFCQLTRDQLSSLAWTDPKEKSKKAPQIVAMTLRFNQIAAWVTKDILETENVKKRLEKMGHYIKICRNLYNIRDYNGLKCILSALQCSPVHRLERTWAMITRKERSQFERLSAFMDHTNNSHLYRVELAKFKIPCVPYLGVYLSDITYTQEALKKSDGNNSSDLKPQYDRIFEEIEFFQSCHYSFDSNPSLHAFLLEDKFINEFLPFVEDESYQASLKIEPRKPKEMRALSYDSIPNRNPLPTRPGHQHAKSMRVESSSLMSNLSSPVDLSPKKDQRAIVSPTTSDTVRREGILVRKNEIEKGQRASHRSWKVFWCVLKGKTINLVSQKTGNQIACASILNGRPSVLIVLELTTSSVAEVATDYTKKMFVLRLKIDANNSMLFQAKDFQDMNLWIDSIQNQVNWLRNQELQLLHTPLPYHVNELSPYVANLQNHEEDEDDRSNAAIIQIESFK